jgi:hypothetical protein
MSRRVNPMEPAPIMAILRGMEKKEGVTLRGGSAFERVIRRIGNTKRTPARDRRISRKVSIRRLAALR